MNEITNILGEHHFLFYGDGMGDFEESSEHATKEVVEQYIVECHRQIRMAQAYLKTLDQI